MSSTVDELNSILSEELDRFFKQNEDKLRPWQTAEWKQNREDIVKDVCEWCGESEEPLHIHHTGSGPKWGREWIKSTDIAFVESGVWDDGLIDIREECPKCGMRDYYARKTKEPTYRCNNCSEEFETPAVVSPEDVISKDSYSTKRYVNSGYYDAKLEWLRDNRSVVREVFWERFEEIMDEYVEMINVVTICQSCHFQYEQTSNRRCENCGENWHSYNKEMCWDCLVDEKGLVKCSCGEGWYQENKYDACSACR